MAKLPKPSLSVVGSTPSARPSDPPETLGQAGSGLWRRVTRAYRIDDVGGQQLLFEACAAADRVAALRARIDQDGEILTVHGVPREHPGLRAELGGRAFIVKTLRALGLDVEPTRPTAGRPGGGTGIRWDRE
jgi:hypothetical protein